MPESTPRLPAHASLEQLRKQAKERLKALRAQGAGATTLADVQFALAREYGFEHWAALVHHIETSTQELRSFEQLAATLAEAYATADVAAIRNVNWTHGMSFVWHREPEKMRRQLPTWYASADRPSELALADARDLVAHKAGFGTWNDLVRSLSAPPSAGLRRSENLPYRTTPAGHLVVDGPVADRRWDAIVALIAERGITSVEVNGLTDAGMKALSRCAQVTRLNIGGAQLSDDGVQHMARMPQLESLELGGPKCQVTDRGLEVMRQLRALRRVSLGWAPRISDAGVAHLAGCEHLELVNLMGTPTGDGSLRALAGKPRLSRLSTGRLVTDDGLPLLHEFPMFREPFRGELKYGLMSFSLETNDVLLDGPFTDEGVRALAGLEGLAGISLFWHTPNFTAGGVQVLAELPNLAFFGCDGKRCTDEAMRHIARIPSLRMLMAQGTVASDVGFEALSRSETIEYIWGRECPNLSGRGFAALASMPRLKGVAVSCARVDDEALATLPRFPALTAFLAMDVPDDGFRHVGRCAALQDLWCMYCRDTTDRATEHLSALKRLRSYYAGSTEITDASLATLGALTTLERLEFWDIAGITDTGVQPLAALPHLQSVTFSGCRYVSRAALTIFSPGVAVTYEP